MSVVVVTGAAGEVGRRLLGVLAADPDVERVVGLDLRRPDAAEVEADVLAAVGGGPAAGDGRVDLRAVDLVTAPLGPHLAGADVVVHLAHDVGLDLEEPATARANVEAAGRLLAAAGEAGVGHVVVVSSAAVYGAWPTNPVPLTEEAPVRPNPGLGYAAQKAEVERRCLEWRAAHEGATVTVLRPAPTVGEGSATWLARSWWSALGMRAGEDPPAQFLHVDDLVAAVDLARRRRLDGAYNVAPDGWVEGEQVRRLAGTPPRLPLPAAVAGRLAAWSWRRRLGPVPPGVLPYTLDPWVVANGKLRAEGWTPTHSNEEAFVGAHAGTPWSRLSPRRRQELALGVAGAGLVGVAGGLVALALALVRRRRR